VAVEHRRGYYARRIVSLNSGERPIQRDLGSEQKKPITELDETLKRRSKITQKRKNTQAHFVEEENHKPTHENHEFEGRCKMGARRRVDEGNLEAKMYAD